MFLLAFVLFYVLLFVRAVPLVKRIVVSPHITSPNASTTWNVGDVVTVTWDTSSIPPGNFTGQLLLGHLTNGSENLDVEKPLAQDFPLSAGSVTITVPNVPGGVHYIAVLFGDSGNKSPQFTITGASSTTTAPSPSSTSTSTSTPPHATPPFSIPVSSVASSPTPSSSSPPPPVSPTSTSTPTSPAITSSSLPVSSPPSSTPSNSVSTTANAPSTSASTSSPKSSNSALPALYARGASAISLCAAAAAAISLMLVL